MLIVCQLQLFSYFVFLGLIYFTVFFEEVRDIRLSCIECSEQLAQREIVIVSERYFSFAMQQFLFYTHILQ